MNNFPPLDDNNTPSHQVIPVHGSNLPSTMVRETMPRIEEEEIHLRDYLDVILRRKWVVIITLLATFFTIGIFTFSATPLYLAKGMIKTSPTARNVTSFQAIDDSFMKSQEYISTQVKLLKSERLLNMLIIEMDLNNNELFSGKNDDSSADGFFSGIKNVIKSLATMLKDIIRPQDNTEAASAVSAQLAEQITLDSNLNRIKNSLKVTPVKDTQLIEISIESEHSRLSADMVNTLMAQFLHLNIQGQVDTLQSAEVFLDKQIESAKIKLENSEQELNKYASRSGIISLDSKLNLTMRQLEEVNDALSQAVTLRINKESLYRQTQKDGGENLQAVLNNLLLQDLKKQYSTLSSQYEVLSTTFKDEYPEVKKIKAQLKDLQNRYNKEVQGIVDSIRLEYEAALDNEKRLIEKAESQKQLAMTLNDKATQYKILEREVTTNNEIYNSLLTRSKELGATTGSDAGQIEIVDTARPPLFPYKPNVQRQLLLAILLGLFGGVGLAFLLEYMDNTIKSPEEFSRRYRIPVLGLIPYTENDEGEDRDLAFMLYTDPKAPLSEAIRTTMFSIELSSSETPPKTMMLTSVLPDAGKSTLSCNFCLSLLTSKARVLLIDTDLRKPTLHHIFGGSDNSIGLSTFLAGGSDLEKVLQKTQFENLFFIPSGPIPPNPAELLASSRMRNFIATASKKFDYIIIDTPPFHGFAEILILSNMVDGVILVSELNKTPREGIEYFRKAVTNVGGKILGVLINKTGRGGKGYGYYGGYKYQNYYNYEYGLKKE